MTSQVLQWNGISEMVSRVVRKLRKNHAKNYDAAHPTERFAGI